MEKKLLIAIALLGFTTSFAGEANFEMKSEHLFDEPITFIERGIEFFVFPNGEFDFNTEAAVGDTYFRRGNGSLNGSHLSPSSFGGVQIEHDAMGRVRRIGNVFVNYDYANRIKRIGTVYMVYGRPGLLQVGGLKLIYDRQGRLVDVVGHVKNLRSYAYTTGYNYYYGPSYGSYYGSNIYYRKAENKDEPVYNKR